MSIAARLLTAACTAIGLCLTARAMTKNWVADNAHGFVGLIPCRGTDFGYRTDRPAVIDWIHSH